MYTLIMIIAFKNYIISLLGGATNTELYNNDLLESIMLRVKNNSMF